MSWDDGESCGILAMMCFLWYGYMKNIAQFYLEVVEDPFLFGLSVCMPRGRTVNRVESSRVDHQTFADTWNNDESSQCRFCHVEESPANHLPLWRPGLSMK